ncbi:hypothetical protein Tco_0573189 [Tanacetum coccineum]
MNVSYFGRSIEYLEICLEHKFSTPFFLHLRKIKSQERGFYFNFKFGISGLLHQWSLQIADIKGGKDSQRELMTSSGKKCEKNYSSVRRYVADPVNVSPNGQPLSLLSKEQDLKWFATNSDENEVFQDMQLIQKLRDDQKCMKKVEHSSRSKATEDIISIGSFMEVLVLNHYVLVRKIL